MRFPKLKPSMSPRISACVARPARPGNMYLPSCHVPAGPISGEEESEIEKSSNVIPWTILASVVPYNRVFLNECH